MSAGACRDRTLMPGSLACWDKHGCTDICRAPGKCTCQAQSRGWMHLPSCPEFSSDDVGHPDFGAQSPAERVNATVSVVIEMLIHLPFAERCICLQNIVAAIVMGDISEAKQQDRIARVIVDGVYRRIAHNRRLPRVTGSA